MCVGREAGSVEGERSGTKTRLGKRKTFENVWGKKKGKCRGRKERYRERVCVCVCNNKNGSGVRV